MPVTLCDTLQGRSAFSRPGAGGPRRAMALARRAAAAAAERGEPPALAELLTEASWRRELAGEFARPHAVRLAEFLASEWRTQAVFPPQPLIFRRGALLPRAPSAPPLAWGVCCFQARRGNSERPCSICKLWSHRTGAHLQLTPLPGRIGLRQRYVHSTIGDCSVKSWSMLKCIDHASDAPCAAGSSDGASRLVPTEALAAPVMNGHSSHLLWHGCGRAFNSCPFDRVRVVIIGQARMSRCLMPGSLSFHTMPAAAHPHLQARCSIGTLICLICQRSMAGGGRMWACVCARRQLRSRDARHAS